MLMEGLAPGDRARQQDVLAELGACALRGGDADLLLREAARLIARGLNADICAILQCQVPEDRLLIRASVGWANPPEGKIGPALAATACHAIQVGEAVLSNAGDGHMPPPAMLRRQGIVRAIDVVIWSGGAKFGVIEAGFLHEATFAPADVAFAQAAANLLGVALSRRETEAALAEAELRTSAILESISDNFYALDRQWRFTYLNRHCEEWCGKRREEVLGKSIWEVFPQAVGTPVQAAHLRAMRERRIVLTDVRSSLRPTWVEFNIHPTDAGLSVFFRDIDDRKRAEFALRDSEERLRLATESVGIGTWELDLQTRRAVRSDAHAAIFGADPSTPWVEDDLERHILRRDRQMVQQARREAIEAGKELHYTCRIRRANDGAIRWIESRGAPARDATGAITRYFGVVVDVTERKEAEALRERLSDQLEMRVAERTQALALANARLTEEMAERKRTEAALVRAQRHEAVGQLVAGVAHAFNNLLTTTIGSLELLDLEKLPAAPRRTIERAMQSALRAGGLTHKLLAFAGRQFLSPRPVDANDVLIGMQDVLSQMLGRRARLQTDCAPHLWPAAGDAEQLRTLVVNLVANARDAMASGGNLRIATRNVAQGDASLPADLPDGDYVLLSVADDGRGMPPEVLARACEPFFTTKRDGRGAGLGLAQVDGVVRELGGTVRLSSTPGKGTIVELFLPRSKAPAGAAPDAAAVDAPISSV